MSGAIVSDYQIILALVLILTGIIYALCPRSDWRTSRDGADSLIENRQAWE